MSKRTAVVTGGAAVIVAAADVIPAHEVQVKAFGLFVRRKHRLDAHFLGDYSLRRADRGDHREQIEGELVLTRREPSRGYGLENEALHDLSDVRARDRAVVRPRLIRPSEKIGIVSITWEVITRRARAAQPLVQKLRWIVPSTAAGTTQPTAGLP